MIYHKAVHALMSGDGIIEVQRQVSNLLSSARKEALGACVTHLEEQFKAMVRSEPPKSDDFRGGYSAAIDNLRIPK